MKKFLLLFGIITLVSSLVFAQTNAPASNPGSAAGNKGILFQFSGLNVLGAGAYNGGIGGKYFLSDYMAARGVICLGISSSKTPANAPVGQVGIDGENSSSTFGIGAAVEIHLTKSRISPFFGGGIMMTTRSTESKPAAYGAPGTTINQTVTKNAGGYTEFSFGGILGVEYYITDGVSLSAEYLVGVALTSNKDVEVTTAGRTTTTAQGSSTNIGISNGGTLTLAVYF
ncbi:MAG: outer membrane beta-barrel protein [Bacteroidetes bacterium]|nr:outer membrane beta-barrel protein [Bacteroidota bacterium]